MERASILRFTEVADRSAGMRSFEQFARERQCPLPRWWQATLSHPEMYAPIYVIACLGLERIRGEGMMWHLSLSASRTPIPQHSGGLAVDELWLLQAAMQVIPDVSLEIDRAESKPHCIHAFGRPAAR